MRRATHKKITDEYLKALAYLNQAGEIPFQTLNNLFKLNVPHQDIPECDGSFELPIEFTHQYGVYDTTAQLQYNLRKLIPFRHAIYEQLGRDYEVDHGKNPAFLNANMQELITMIVRYSPFTTHALGKFLLMPHYILEQVAFNNSNVEFLEPLIFSELESDRLVTLVEAATEGDIRMRYRLKGYRYRAEEEARINIRNALRPPAKKKRKKAK